MYTHQDDLRDVEEICYEDEHIAAVQDEMKSNFDDYFNRFLESNAGYSITDKDFAKLQEKFGNKVSNKQGEKDRSASYKHILINARDEFEKDQEKYLAIFDLETLDELEEVPMHLKTITLKLECPIIRAALFNKRAKQLDKYRADFSRADAGELYDVVRRLCEFGEKYQEDIYDKEHYDDISSYEEIEMNSMDTDEFTVYGVIGGGIKSHMLYKVHPNTFPNRSRAALWALWYLTNKKSFGCETDSEFLMIDIDKVITQQNYFYPYQLFAYYAFYIYKLLKEKAQSLGVDINPEYRYIVVDAFFNYVAKEHQAEIDFFSTQIKNGGMDYA